MKTRAARLGIIGGIAGIIAGIFNCIIFLFKARSTAWVSSGEISLGFMLLSFVFIFAILGLVGGAITKDRPLVGGVLMLIGGIGGFPLALVSWIPAGILLLMGSILSLKQRT